MSSKVKRKVTVENPKESDDQPRRPSVFERLGAGAVNVTAQPQDRHSRVDQNEKCRNWLRTGSCAYGNACRYQHDPFPASTRRVTKSEKEANEKDLRHKMKIKRDDTKESRTGSVSPKRKGSKRSGSRSRKGEHESKIKSTVVVTRPRSPPSSHDIVDIKKKPDGSWEEDSDDWPMDAAQLDYKEELTLERKRQQLQRELELELQKERLLNENVSFSESSSSSSSSDSGSISSSSGSTTSSSEDDSDESTSSSSSSSSSGSRKPIKRRVKKQSGALKEPERHPDPKPKGDYDKIRSGRGSRSARTRSPSPQLEVRHGRRGKDKRNATPASPKRKSELRSTSGGRASVSVSVKARGPRTPSPGPASRKQRHWGQSSSADSRSDLHRGRGKRHKKKREASRNEKRRSDRPTPPPLSSPNRTALLTSMPTKKSKQRGEDSSGKSRRHGRDPSPVLLSRATGSNAAPLRLPNPALHSYGCDPDKVEKHRLDDRSKLYGKKEPDELLSKQKRTDSRERGNKRSRQSPRKDTRMSPHKDRYEAENFSGRRLYSPADKDDKPDRRRASLTPPKAPPDRRKLPNEDKKRDIRDVSPRVHERMESQFRNSEVHGYDKRGAEPKSKRMLSPEVKKGREDRSRDRSQKDRSGEYDTAWPAEHRKGSSIGRRTPEPRGRQEIRSQGPGSSERSRERDSDRKKRKDREIGLRPVDDVDRPRLSPRSQSPLHGHHGVREIEPLTGNRGHLYDPDLPPGERDYAYGYDPLHDPYLSDRLLPPEYEQDVLRGPPLYPPDMYPELRYRRDGSLKDPGPLMDRYGARDLSPSDILPHRDVISLTHGEDYLPDIPLDERAYDDRWPRGRGGRDSWDPYGSLPPATLPPHMAAALDEDRYGMPRRRRSSSEWPRGRPEDRDPSLLPLSHRQPSRNQLPMREGRSRSPLPKGPGAGRSWQDRPGRHDSRSADNRHEDSQKVQDDRKTRSVRKERSKRKDDSSTDTKTTGAKDKASSKRQRSPSPKDNKRKKDDSQSTDNTTEKSSTKKTKDDVRSDSKSSSHGQRAKSEASPRHDSSSKSSTQEKDKVESSSKGSNESRTKEKDDRRSKRNEDKAHGGDDFSDWSDGDDELLNRDDVEGDSNSRNRHKREETTTRRKDRMPRDQKQKVKERESHSRTSSKERVGNSASQSSKDGKTDSKETAPQNSYVVKEDMATDVDEYVTAESVDYDPISDDELDALIEEPDDSLMTPTNDNEKSKIVDALDVNWSALMNESKTEFVPGFARRRFKAAHMLSKIGFSQAFAGPELTQKIIETCQKQLDEEQEQQEDEETTKDGNKEPKKFTMEHPIAAFHVAISQSKKERVNIFNQVGPYRRALCARRDLHIRKLLCRSTNKLTPTSPVTYSPQYSVVDKDLYKQSLKLLKLKDDHQPQIVNVCS